MAQEFLPLCDVLFNIISLASYFCDIVFDVVTVYTLYLHYEFVWFTIALSCIVVSLVSSQLLSLKWYLQNSQETKLTLTLLTIFLMHISQCGVLWRYFKLFIPVELGQVKIEVRDLCMLRLVHAFCEAAPLLLIQLYLIWLKPSANEVSDLNIVSTMLSLFSICWALASFNKNVRRKNMHRLVLTWLGVIFQFLWRLGTVASRAISLTVYATLYHYWVFAVIGLHWLSMLLWIMSPKNVFHGENMSLIKKVSYSMLIAYVYIFCYINLHETNPRQKYITFYVTMFLENSLLMAVWLGLRDDFKWFQYPTIAIVWGGFFLGIAFMGIYYWFFHIKRLKHLLTEANQASLDQLNQVIANNYLTNDGSTVNLKSKLAPNFKTQKSAIFHSGTGNNGTYQNGVTNVPGVFNCRLNPGLKRKKKKPSSFIPPPPVPAPIMSNGNNGKMAHPFWKRTPPKYCNSDHESVGSRVNIQQKLQEKKQQQLQELKEIEEEIKQGKLERPHPSEISDSDTICQPIPRAKKQPWFQPDLPSLLESQMMYSSLLGCPIQPEMRLKRKLRSQTPEILLAPHYLDNSRIYYEYQEPRGTYSIIPNVNLHRQASDLSSNSNFSSFEKPVRSRNKPPLQTENGESQGSIYKSYRIPSDLDSQISLPRSYTLPREFRYYRRHKVRKPVRQDHFAASNNSSDGDVDSVDDNDMDPIPNDRLPPRSRQYALHFRSGMRQHETKL